MDEITSINIAPQLAEQLGQTYAWLDDEHWVNLTSPVGIDEEALEHYRDNTELNHHDLNRLLRRPVSAKDVLATVKNSEISTTTQQYLATFLYQFSQKDNRYLPLMSALALNNYDVVGIFSLPLTPETTDLVATLDQLVTTLLQQLAPKMNTFDHTPDEEDQLLPPQLVIKVDAPDKTTYRIPVALIDWLSTHLPTLSAQSVSNITQVITYLNQQTDSDSLIIRRWLVRKDDNQNTLKALVFAHLD